MCSCIHIYQLYRGVYSRLNLIVAYHKHFCLQVIETQCVHLFCYWWYFLEVKRKKVYFLTVFFSSHPLSFLSITRWHKMLGSKKYVVASNAIPHMLTKQLFVLLGDFPLYRGAFCLIILRVLLFWKREYSMSWTWRQYTTKPKPQKDEMTTMFAFYRVQSLVFLFARLFEMFPQDGYLNMKVAFLSNPQRSPFVCICFLLHVSLLFDPFLLLY